MKRHLYFAYGSNLSGQQMQTRCPGSTYVATGYLPQHALIFDGFEPEREGAVANVLPAVDTVVWGVLYDMTAHDLELMDGFEDFPLVYQRKSVKIILQNGDTAEAFVYFRPPQQLGEPAREYAEIIAAGAYEHNLPESYIAAYLAPHIRPTEPTQTLLK